MSLVRSVPTLVMLLLRPSGHLVTLLVILVSFGILLVRRVRMEAVAFASGRRALYWTRVGAVTAAASHGLIVRVKVWRVVMGRALVKLEKRMSL